MKGRRLTCAGAVNRALTVANCVVGAVNRTAEAANRGQLADPPTDQLTAPSER
jgi:hypothetical protein